MIALGAYAPRGPEPPQLRREALAVTAILLLPGREPRPAELLDAGVAGADQGPVRLPTASSCEHGQADGEPDPLAYLRDELPESGGSDVHGA